MSCERRMSFLIVRGFVVRQEIKNLKQLKVQKDALLSCLLDLQMTEKRLMDELHQCRQKQAKIGFDVEAINKRAFDMIGELK